MKANRMTLKGALGRIRMHHIREMAQEIPEHVQAPEAPIPGMHAAPGLAANDDLVVQLSDDDEDDYN